MLMHLAGWALVPAARQKHCFLRNSMLQTERGQQEDAIAGLGLLYFRYRLTIAIALATHRARGLWCHCRFEVLLATGLDGMLWYAQIPCLAFVMDVITGTSAASTIIGAIANKLEIWSSSKWWCHVLRFVLWRIIIFTATSLFKIRTIPTILPKHCHTHISHPLFK